MEPWEHELISESDFTQIWGAYNRRDGNLFFFEDVRDQPINRVWSVTDSGGSKPDHWIASPGFHVVNVLGYVMTTEPWSKETPDAFYIYDDFDGDDETYEEFGAGSPES